MSPVHLSFDVWIVFYDNNAGSKTANRAFATDHPVGDDYWTVAARQSTLFAHWAERAVVAKEVINAFGMKYVAAWEFTDCGYAGFKVVETNRAGGLRVRSIRMGNY
jgi:hypothetical protein